MILKADKIADLLEFPDKIDPFVIAPKPDLKKIRQSGSASIDLRLGTWFLSLRQAKFSCMSLTESPEKYTKYHFVPFGGSFILHPNAFVLGITLEWLRFNSRLAGIVTGKSSWGRRGLNIATASGIHPGFTGCLALELTNLSEIPIEIQPGRSICQLFLHTVYPRNEKVDRSPFIGHRKPVLCDIKSDKIAEKLSSKRRH